MQTCFGRVARVESDSTFVRPKPTEGDITDFIPAKHGGSAGTPTYTRNSQCPLDGTLTAFNYRPLAGVSLFSTSFDVVEKSNSPFKIPHKNKTPKKNKTSQCQGLVPARGMGDESKAAGDDAMGAQLQRRIIEVLRKRKAGATC